MGDEPRTSKVPDTDRDPHSAETAIIESRRAKAAGVRARHENPFANDVRPQLGGRTCDIAEVRDLAESARDPASKYDEARVKQLAGAGLLHVRGRVIAHRSTGGLAFLRLRDRTGEIQLLVSSASLGATYEHLSEIDVGDVVEAEGTLTASKRGELSIEPRRVRLLTKAYRPLPEKWHGLTDVELRYRQRYVDLVANPAVADVFRARSHIVRATRAILDEHGFLEVETPTMHTLIGGAAARPFETHHNALDMDLFMRIAPELYLKRLVVGGLERVYEIGRCYRNEGISTRHNPEFTMLEFYQAYATYDDLMDFTEVLLRGIDRGLAAAMPAAHALWKEARPFTLDQPFPRVPMDRAVAVAAERTAIPEWLAAVEDQGGAGLVALLRVDFGERIKEWAKASPRAKSLDWGNFRKGLAKCDSDGERLFACYEYVVEPFLVEDYRTDDGKRSVPVFVKDYPFEVSPLARRNDRNPDLTDRFELFVHGREV
jgi:lysyl-tRNA synthetase class 2